MRTLLWITDLAYEARDRRYGDEDVWLTSQLRRSFHIALAHPLDTVALMDRFDAVVVRNSGPVIQYREAWDAFRAAATARGTRVFNPLTGRGDMTGKRYLVELTDAGFPVIPTVDRRDRLGRLPDAERYVVKPVLGADGLGVQVIAPEHLASIALDGLLVQPFVDFAYELSFYFVGRTFQYALHAPDPARRWDLVPFAPTAADLAFAQRFVEWNGLDLGVQRVDACRTRDGELLLVELEDLNPYLSLDRLDSLTRSRFVDAFERSLRALHA
jgi:hypothetical protein